MLKIEILAIGKLSQEYLRVGEREYLKRINPYYDVNVIELSEHKLQKSNPSDIQKVIQSEGQSIIKLLEKRKYPSYALAIEGIELSSTGFAKMIDDTALNQSGCVFIIGGSYGLSEEVKESANAMISLSRMTFPHQLSRIVLLEQIYRAATINQGITYHK